MAYHNLEEGLIALISIVIGLRSFHLYRRGRAARSEQENNGRVFFTGIGFSILGINSAVHTLIHVLQLNENMLFQTLLGYSVGLLMLIFAIASHAPDRSRFLAFFYLPVLLFFLPDVYRGLPDFGTFRPLIWIIISYFSGTLCILHLSVYKNTGMRPYLLTALSFFLITVSAIFLFFPSAIGSSAWIHGHGLRPLGFVILFFVMRKDTLGYYRSSILYRAVTIFTLLAGLPLICFGIAISYQDMSPGGLVNRRLLIFLLLLVTLVVSLVFGIGLVSRLLSPIIRLKEGIDSLPRKGLDHRIEIASHDEIEDLAKSFNLMAAELQRSVEERVRLTRLAATGELAAALAHEIRNPLNAIGGAASYIKQNYKGSLITEFLSIITAEVTRINRLTSSLLAFSKPVVPQRTPSDMNRVVGESVALIRQEYANKGVSLASELDGVVPLVSVDPNQMKQVLINLLVNALEATEEGGSVIVKTGTVNGTIKVSVQDSGRGIREEDMKKVFNPFFTTKTTGTGLGLSISERIVKEHGGMLTVESSESRGSTFSVVLPLTIE